MNASAILELLPERTKKEEALIEKAYVFAATAHQGQKRFSGEPYVNHTARVAETLAKLGMDVETVVAGLLHDTVEDCDVTKETLALEFGEKIAALVSGVSKLGTLRYQGRGRYAENLRRLFVATALDVRVILIKLADRLDNVKTLAFVPKEKQERIAIETLEIYAPIAHRLGMGKLKTELEDTAFAFAYPAEFAKVRSLIKEHGNTRKRYLEKVYRTLGKELARNGLTSVKMDYRVKGTYSTYRKLLKHGMDIEKLHDLYALRVIVPRIEDCYRVLGLIHNLWKPLPGKIKDYIATPKINRYRSLHTTVFTGDGGIAEIQVRTADMHEEAEYGIAAHLLYKESFSGNQRELDQRLEWLTRIKAVHASTGKPEEFLNNVKIDFFTERIFVFTPRGDAIELPEGATALDFAYAIHSDIGDHAQGAHVNGKYVALNTKLGNGDIINVEVKKSSHPTHKWIEFTKTSLARRHIRSYLGKDAPGTVVTDTVEKKKNKKKDRGRRKKG